MRRKFFDFDGELGLPKVVEIKPTEACNLKHRTYQEGCQPNGPKANIESQSLKHSGEKKIAVKPMLGVILALLIAGAFYLRNEGHIPSSETVFDFLASHTIAAPLVFILLYSIMPSLFLPTLPLNIGAGFLWGAFWGSFYSVIGFAAGSAVAFLISRYIAGDYFRNRFNFKAWKWILRAVDKNGWKTVAFTRVNPIFPSAVLSYLFGITAIRFWEYLWATVVFIIPASIAMAAFGSSIKEFTVIGNLKGIATGITITVVALAVLFGLRPIIKRLAPKREDFSQPAK